MTSSLERNLFSDEYLRQIHMWARGHGLTGKDVKIAILDTGIIRETEFLRDAIEQIPGTEQWRLNTTTESTDLVGTHGTEVASLIRLIAPDAKIFDVKAACIATRTLDDFLLGALEECVNTIKPDIVNVSLGIHHRAGCEGYCRLCRMVNYVADQGIIVVASAGNRGRSGPTACPGNASGAISVGGATYVATESGYKIKVADMSSWSWIDGKPNLVAPFDIPVKVRYYLLVPTWIEITVDETHLGTSYSAPFVTGAIALLLQQKYNAKNPAKFASDVEAAIVASASPLNGVPKASQGTGIIDLPKASSPFGLV